MKRKIKRDPFQELAKLNAAPSVKVAATPYDGRTGLQKFTAEYEEEQREPIRKAEQQISTTLRTLIEQDTPTLYSAPSTYLEATAPNVGDGSVYAGIDPQEIRARIRKSFSTFEDSIAAEGKLTASGKQKLQRLAQSNLTIAWDSPEAWSRAFILLRQSGELKDQGDSDQPDFVVTEIQDEPEVNGNRLDKLESLDLSTRDGQRLARGIADEHYFSVESAAMFTQWLQLLYDTWGVTLSDTQQRAVVEFFLRWNKSPLRHESYNEARRALVKTGIFPSHMILEDEVLAERIEHSNLNDYSARQEFAQEARRIVGR